MRPVQLAPDAQQFLTLLRRLRDDGPGPCVRAWACDVVLVTICGGALAAGIVVDAAGRLLRRARGKVRS